MLRELILPSGTNLQEDPWNSAVLVTPRHSVRMKWNAEAIRQHCTKSKETLYIVRAEDTVKGTPLMLAERIALLDVTNGARGTIVGIMLNPKEPPLPNAPIVRLKFLPSYILVRKICHQECSPSTVRYDRSVFVHRLSLPGTDDASSYRRHSPAANRRCPQHIQHVRCAVEKLWTRDHSVAARVQRRVIFRPKQLPGVATGRR